MTTINARISDPSTSHIAGETIEQSGHGQKQRDLCLAAVQLHPGLTARELEQTTGLDYYMLCRRLPELRDELLVRTGAHRKSNGSNRLMQTWYPSERLF